MWFTQKLKKVALKLARGINEARADTLEKRYNLMVRSQRSASIWAMYCYHTIIVKKLWIIKNFVPSIRVCTVTMTKKYNILLKTIATFQGTHHQLCTYPKSKILQDGGDNKFLFNLMKNQHLYWLSWNIPCMTCLTVNISSQKSFSQSQNLELWHRAF